MGFTYINGSILIDTNSTTPLEDVAAFLEKAPKIVGGERDCEIFVNQPPGYNWSFSEGEFQTRVILTLCGSLRYTYFGDTVSEYKAFFEELKKNFSIESETVLIYDLAGSTKTFSSSVIKTREEC